MSVFQIPRMRAIILAVLAGVALAGAAAAQEGGTSDNRVAARTDWSVFVEDNPTECWAVSAPKKTVATRNGRKVSVRRGDILLFVSFRPGSNVKGEVAFTGGYPYAKGSTVRLTVDDTRSWELFTEGEWAWANSPAEDAEIIAAFKAGEKAVLVGRSRRGTVTTDSFSLLGFTAALEEAARRCGS